MKNSRIIIKSSIVAALAAFSSGAFAAYSFNTRPPNAGPTLDAYYGSGVTGNQSSNMGLDGINDAFATNYDRDNYEIHSLESAFSNPNANDPNSVLTVKVNTNFSSNSYFTGDLLFDTSWKGFDASNTPDFLRNDDYKNGDWGYVVHINGDPYGDANNADQSATVYRINYAAANGKGLGDTGWNPNNVGDTLRKDDIFYLSTCRGDPGNCFGDNMDRRQEVRVGADPAQGNLDSLTTLTGQSVKILEKIGDATWDIVDGSYVSFSFDLFQAVGDHTLLTELGVPVTFAQDGAVVSGDFELAYHWTMSCGNDVIEAVQQYTVTGKPPGTGGNIPEPATLALFSIGLIGLAGRGRGMLSRKAA